MASSNKHWPSMFKSKPNNTNHHQWQHGINSPHISTGQHRNPYTPAPVSGCEERTPEPKPRWNPRPEQIRILEAIFNSGMVNPPRDEIRKIRVQLQEYGQVGDANVFYWFQNRKSRSKHKHRHLLQNSNKSQLPPPPVSATYSGGALVTAPTSSSSSSDKSSPNNSNYEKALHVGSSTVIDLLNNNSPTASVNQPLFRASSGFSTEQAPFFPVQQNSGGSISAGLTQGFFFPHVSCVADINQSVGNYCSSELMLMSNGPPKDEMKMQQQFIVSPSLSNLSPTNHALQGVGLGESSQPKTTVFINDVCFEVAMEPFNVRETFGDDTVLLHSSGQPVLTNEWGLTLQPLENGASYYLLRAFMTRQLTW